MCYGMYEWFVTYVVFVMYVCILCMYAGVIMYGCNVCMYGCCGMNAYSRVIMYVMLNVYMMLCTCVRYAHVCRLPYVLMLFMCVRMCVCYVCMCVCSV